jgi:phage shock protein PspC (stress-responsive transcriptional regulator)
MQSMDSGPSAAPPTGENQGQWGPPPPPRHPPVERRRLYREPEDKKLAGICGGLADYTGVDPALLRAGAVLLVVMTPLTVIAYLVAIFAIDERPQSTPRVVAPPVEVLERNRWLPLLLIAVALLMAVGGGTWWWLGFDMPLAAPVLIGVGVYLLARSRSAPGDGPDPFAGSTGPPPNVVDPAGQNSWSPSQEATNLSLGVDITTRNEESGPTVDRTADLRDAADDEPGVGGLAQRTGSSPAHEGAGPPGEFPPLTPPEWPGPEAGADPPSSTFGAVPTAWTGPTAPAGPAGTARDGPERRSERLGLVVSALVLIGAGVAWLLHVVDAVDVDPRPALAVGLVAIGLGLALAAWRGRARAALIPLGLVAVAGLAGGEVVDVPLDAGVGERTVVATRPSQVDEPVELLIGDLVVDLRDMPLSDRRPTEVEAGVGLGELRVVVPRNAQVVVDADVRGGEVGGALVTDSGQQDTGVLLDERYVIDGPAGAPRLELTLDVGIGRAEVVRG